MKRIVVIIAGAVAEARDLTIEPGTTARDILNELELEGYELSREKVDDVFNPDENVYAAVEDGEKLNAVSNPVVGKRLLSKHF